jgi:hypothetical protein
MPDTIHAIVVMPAGITGLAMLDELGPARGAGREVDEHRVVGRGAANAPADATS